MGILSYGYKAGKTPVGKKVVETVKDFFKSRGKNITPGVAINKVNPNVPKTKLDKAKSKLAIATQKTRASTAKLGQTMFESKNKAFKKDDFTFAKTNKKTESNKEAYKRIQGENTKVLKSMIDDAFKDKKKKTKVFKAPENFNKGGRVGLKGGSDLGMQSVKYGLDKKPEVTKLDRIAKFIAKDKKKKKKFESPIAKAINKKNKKRFV